MTTTMTTTTIIRIPIRTSRTMLDDFLTRALLAGLAVAAAAGPLGCFVVWRRMAYFGDATAHAAILGVALALGFQISIFAGTLVVALGMALIVSTLAGRGWAMDTTLGVLAHSGLAFGLVAVSFLPNVRVDLHAFLFGDILAVSRADLAVIAGGAALVVALLVWRWSALLTATLSEDLAHAAGINPAAARNFARTPETMALASVLLGGVAVWAGLRLSLWQDTPAGPSIVVVAALLFAGATLGGMVVLKRRL
jgi:zinc transport system permease protein